MDIQFQSSKRHRGIGSGVPFTPEEKKIYKFYAEELKKLNAYRAKED